MHSRQVRAVHLKGFLRHHCREDDRLCEISSVPLVAQAGRVREIQEKCVLVVETMSVCMGGRDRERPRQTDRHKEEVDG